HRLVSALQNDFPLVPHPFAQLAADQQVSEDTALRLVQTWFECGALRRIALLAKHQNLGFRANAMCVWQIPTEKVDDTGLILAKHPEVSHCYERTPFPGMPGNVYAMVHSTNPQTLRHLVNTLEKDVGFSALHRLHSIHEYKKSSLRL
ncbi:MAG TPA: hypothetical protein VLM37_08445, partial [Fibrobacteraceae bacterium]|nr:hypothetical protein [Fibrobacteraceae bacterium]